METIAFDFNGASFVVDLGALNFRPFTDLDWDCFAGCETESPEVCYTETDAYVIDGDLVEGHIDNENGEITFIYNLASGEFEVEPYEQTYHMI